MNDMSTAGTCERRIVGLEAELKDMTADVTRLDSQFADAMEGWHKAEVRIEELEAELKAANRLIFMPGCFRCPQCEFILTKTCINPDMEIIGTRVQDREPEACPNDGTMMVKVTYEEQLKVYADRLKEEFEENERLRAALTEKDSYLDALEWYYSEMCVGCGQYKEGKTHNSDCEWAEARRAGHEMEESK